MKRWLAAGTLGLATICALMTSCASGNTLKLGGDVQSADLHVTAGRDLAITHNWERG